MKNTFDSIVKNSTIIEGCLIPPQKPFKTGYVIVARNGKYVALHRWAWEHAYGPIPEGLVINHLCNNRKCFNIKHLELVTVKENISYAAKQGRLRGQNQTECINGHQFNSDNTYIRKNGTRQCKPCVIARTTARQKKIKVVK